MVITATQVYVDEVLERRGEKVCPLFNTWTSTIWIDSRASDDDDDDDDTGTQNHAEL